MNNNINTQFRKGLLDFIPVERWLACRKEINSTTKQVYAILYGLGQSTGEYYASQNYVATSLGIATRNVREHIRKLESLNLIKTLRNGQNKNNNYLFPLHPWMDEKPFDLEKRLKNDKDFQDSFEDDDDDDEDFEDDLPTLEPDVERMKSSGQVKRERMKSSDPDRTKSSSYYKVVRESNNNILVKTKNFDLFWSEYPRRIKKSESKKIWAKKNLDAQVETVLADLELRKKTEWASSEKAFIPHPTTYLNKEQFLDDPQDLTKSAPNNRVSFFKAAPANTSTRLEDHVMKPGTTLQQAKDMLRGVISQ